MSVATTTAIGIGAAISAGGAIGGSAISAHATGKAADATKDAAANSLAFNQRQYDTTLANERPYLDVGNQAAGALGSGLADGSLTAAYPGGAFHFSPADFQNDPAYQFNQAQGLQAVQRTAAAQGGLVSGGALKEAAGYASGLAANTYQQQYQNALGAYQQAYNQFENTQANTFNRLSSVAGMGQAAASNQAAAGTAAAGTAANIYGSEANSLANLYTGQANATTGALASAGNSIAGGINQAVNTNNYLAQFGMSGSSYGAPPTPAQWNAYDAGSTPAGVRDWRGF